MDLSVRECEVIFEIIQGKAVKEVANDLHISFHTADTHIKNAKRKTGAKNLAELAKIFILAHKERFFVILFIFIQSFSYALKANRIPRRRKSRQRIVRVRTNLKTRTKTVNYIR